jgi:flavodoxin
MEESGGKTLIAFYSRKGQNYSSNGIKDLAIGNTAVVANKIHQLIGGDLFEIETKKPYPEDVKETADVAKREGVEKARPELKSTVENLESYDVIYLGFPMWWYTLPMCVFTFVESYNFSGKTIRPFCTHEGGGASSSESDLRAACPKAKILPILEVRGSTVDSAEAAITNWVRQKSALT